MHLRIINPQRDHAWLQSLLRTNTSESTSSSIVHEDDGLFRKARSTKRTGPYSGEVHPLGKTRASWKAIIPLSIMYGCQSFQSFSTASSLWSPSIKRKSIGRFQPTTASWLKASIHMICGPDFVETARLAARRRKFSGRTLER